MHPPMDPAAVDRPALLLNPAPDPAPGNAITTLSQLALGPVNTAYYSAVFERFDNTGRTPTTWNWAASLFTLSWMVFRQLWGAALAYVAATQGLALLTLGVGRYVLDWPPTVEWGVLGAFALLAFAAPGMYGNALLYADIRKRVDHALTASRTMPEARALLAQKGSSRRRLHVLVLLNTVLAAVAVSAYLVRPAAGAKPMDLEPAVTVAQATVAAQAKLAVAAEAAQTSDIAAGTAATTVPQPTGRPTGTPAGAPANLPVPPARPSATAQGVQASSSPIASTSTPAQAPATGSATALSPAVVTAPAAPSAQPQTQTTAHEHAAASANDSTATSAVAPAKTAKSAAPVQPAAPAAAPATASNPKTTRASTHAADATKHPAQTSKSKATAAQAVASKPASPGPFAPLDSQAAAPVVGTTPGYYINVGLFAEEVNARRTQARLLNEGLPAFRQALNGANGQFVRVRVGPYPSRSAADTAAASIRRMRLEAVVFKQ